MRQLLEKIKQKFVDATQDDVDYEQFADDANGRSAPTIFEGNAPKYRLFRSKVHVKMAATVVAVIGLIATVVFCIDYTIYHTRNKQYIRNEFMDHIQLINLAGAFVVGLPSHIALLYGLHRENKRFLTPFLVYYITNFVLSLIFFALSVLATVSDIHGNTYGTRVGFDIGVTLQWLLWIGGQALAIFIVLRCRKYFDAKERFTKFTNRGQNDSGFSQQSSQDDLPSGSNSVESPVLNVVTVTEYGKNGVTYQEERIIDP